MTEKPQRLYSSSNKNKSHHFSNKLYQLFRVVRKNLLYIKNEYNSYKTNFLALALYVTAVKLDFYKAIPALTSPHISLKWSFRCPLS